MLFVFLSGLTTVDLGTWLMVIGAAAASPYLGVPVPLVSGSFGFVTSIVGFKPYYVSFDFSSPCGLFASCELEAILFLITSNAGLL